MIRFPLRGAGAVRGLRLISLFIVSVVLGVSMLGRGTTAWAGETDVMAKEIEQLVRSAEQQINAGRLDDAEEALTRAKEKLGKLEAAEPRHRAVRPMTARLAAAMKKYEGARATGSPDGGEGGSGAASTHTPSSGSVTSEDQSPAGSDSADSAGASDPEADAKLMIELYDTYFPEFDLIHGNSLVYGVKESDAQSALDQVETAEALLPELSGDLGRLADTYGTEPLQIGNNLHRLGVKIPGDPGGRLAYLIEATGKIQKSREASAVSCAQNAEMLLGNHSGPITDARLKRMNEVKALLVIGQELDPDNEKVREMLAEIDEQITGAVAQMEAEIDAATWAGNVAGFAGPGDAGVLAKEAVGYFRGHRGWGARLDKKIEVLDVCVRGPWQVADRDIFGRVIRWRLPIHVAVTDPDLRPRNIARVYELSILAMEGAPNGAPKAPPFDGYWVGNSWMMRLDKF